MFARGEAPVKVNCWVGNCGKVVLHFTQHYAFNADLPLLTTQSSFRLLIVPVFGQFFKQQFRLGE